MLAFLSQFTLLTGTGSVSIAGHALGPKGPAVNSPVREGGVEAIVGYLSAEGARLIVCRPFGPLNLATTKFAALTDEGY